jgi:hypothetical protein
VILYTKFEAPKQAVAGTRSVRLFAAANELDSAGVRKFRFRPFPNLGEKGGTPFLIFVRTALQSRPMGEYLVMA